MPILSGQLQRLTLHGIIFKNMEEVDLTTVRENGIEPSPPRSGLADEASRWIRERNPEKPFFLYVPFIAPTLHSVRPRIWSRSTRIWKKKARFRFRR